MSEFWKKRRPRLSEDEERALWERVRTMPSEAAGRGARARSPWAALWARPAVRFGAPVLAVALVAIVWVAQREPEAPRPETMSQAPPSEVLREAAPPVATTGPAEEGAPAIASEEALDAAPQRGRENLASGAAPQMTKEAKEAREEREASTFAAPPAASTPSAPAADAGRKDEASRAAAKVGAAEVPAPTKVSVIKGGAGTQAIGARGEAESPTDPRVAAIRGGDYVSGLFEEVMRPEGDGPMRLLLSRPFTGGRALVTRDAAGRWEVRTEPATIAGPLAPPGLARDRAGLAVELERAVRAADPAAIERVRQAGLRFLDDSPEDPGAAALLQWCDAAVRALGSD